MRTVSITPGENREYTLENGALTIFAYEFMHTVKNTPIQTRALLQLLLDHKGEIEAAAQAQEQQEAQPKPSRTIDQRIDDLFI